MKETKEQKKWEPPKMVYVGQITEVLKEAVENFPLSQLILPNPKKRRPQCNADV